MSGFLASIAGATYAPPVANAAVSFDGNEDYYSATGLTTTATDGKYMTFAFTFYLPSSATGKFMDILGIELGGGSGQIGFLAILQSTRLHNYFTNSAGSTGQTYGDFEITTSNAWHQIVYYHDATSFANCKYYVDGVDRTSSLLNGPSFGEPAMQNVNFNWGVTGAKVYIGNGIIGTGFDASDEFDGRISQLYLHNAAGAPNITKFWNTTSNLPIDLGTQGTATGLTRPLIYHYGTTSTFPTNNGTGFNSYTLTATGDVTGAAGPTYGEIMPVVVNSAFTDDTSTKILLHFENTVVDDNSSGRTAVATQTLHNAGAYRTDQKKFGTYSVGSTGVPGGWSTNNPSALNPGTGDFTIEFWFRPCATANSDQITMTSQSTGSVHIFLEADSGFIGFGKQNISWDVQTTVGAISVAWHHFAVTRSGTTLRLFLDGTVRDTVTGNTDNYTSNVWSFSMGGLSPTYFHMDEFRISSIARYTSNFTVA